MTHIFLGMTYTYLEWHGLFWNEIELFGIKINEKECSKSVGIRNVPIKKMSFDIALFAWYSTHDRSDVPLPSNIPIYSHYRFLWYSHLVGGFNPSEKYVFVSWDDSSQYMDKNKIQVPVTTNQIDII